MKRILPGVLGILFWIFFTQPVFATRSLTIESNKSSLFGEEEMTITASASGFTTGEIIYTKGAFYKEGSTNYFSYTKKDSEWIKNGETATSQKSIVIGTWDGKLDVKVDFSDSGFQGEGDYKFKVGFYHTTSGGSLSSVNWSDTILSMTINEPNYTPTPTPIPTNTPTPTSLPTPTKTPIPAPTSTPTKTPTPTQKSSPSNLPTESISDTQDNEEAVLGESTVAEKSIEIASQKESGSAIPFVLMGVGALCLGGYGILAYRGYLARKKLE